jgi:hypothetical protein
MSFKTRLFYPLGKSFRYPSAMRLSEFQSQSVRSGDDEFLFPSAGNRTDSSYTQAVARRETDSAIPMES